jgi:hypothetical protein
MPMILIFASAQARRDRFVAVPTWIFVAGYILVWASAGLVVYVLVQTGDELVSRLASLDRRFWAPLALGATLTVAGCISSRRSSAFVSGIAGRLLPLWHSIGATDRPGRSAWGCDTASTASAAAGLYSLYLLMPG